MLAAIRFINCQSFRDVSLELAKDRLNVLVAENNTGKSIFYKMLKVTASPTYFTKDELRELISIGADYAMVVYQFDDGDIGAVVVTKNQVIYKYKTAEEDNFSSYLNPPQILINQLGLVTNGNDFVANIIDMDQDMLLVNSNLKENGELVKLIAENPTLNELEEKCTGLVAEYKGYYSTVSSYLSGIQTQLNGLEFEDVYTLQSELEAQKLCYNTCCKLLDCYDHLVSLQILSKDKIDYNWVMCCFSALQKTNEVLQTLDRIRNVPDVPSTYLTIVTKLIVLQDNVSRIKYLRDYDFSLFPLLEKVNTISGILYRIHIISPKLEIMQTLTVSGIKMEQIQKVVTRISQATIQQKVLEEHLCTIQQELLESGEVVQCPIHGEVVYNGKECVPCDN